MHAALLPNGNVVFVDKIETWTHLKLPNGYPAYSSIYNPATQALRPLSLDPTVADGLNAIRYLDANGQQLEWLEPGNTLASNRWYPSAQVMPDGSIFVASGSLNGGDLTVHANNNPTYEILDPNGVSSGVNITMDILVRNQPYWLYPFLHLLKDGTLFIFVSRQSQIFDVESGTVVKEMPDLPSFHRTYPNTGGSVMLPMSKMDDFEPSIMVCGGGQAEGLDSPSEDSCGIIQPMSDKSEWSYTSMPDHRVMVEGVNLLDGTILWLNGAHTGAQGFGLADRPAYDALIYDPTTRRWAKAGTSTIARLYHSVALLLTDGTVLVSGSNPNEMPLHDNELVADNQYRKFPTEFRNEIWTPPYLQGDKAEQRPTGIKLLVTTPLRPGQEFTITFKPARPLAMIDVVLHTNGFVTHAVHMGQVMYHLEQSGWVELTDSTVKVDAKIPDVWLAPGPYFVYVVANGVPGVGQPVIINYGDLFEPVSVQ
ncbi:hypothetical protein DV737_g2586, partial [Chaetothyriales sp. CBS 132003]